MRKKPLKHKTQGYNGITVVEFKTNHTTEQLVSVNSLEKKNYIITIEEQED